MPSTLALLLLPLVSVIADSRHLSETTTESTGGLGAGAIVGIIFGILAVVSCIGAALQPVDPRNTKLLTDLRKGGEPEFIMNSASAVSSRVGDNNLPMMAMQANPTSMRV